MQPHASPIILALLLSLTAAAIALAVPPHPLTTIPPNPHPHHLLPQKRSLLFHIRGLPDGYTGIFTTFASISPKSPAPATFIRFFTKAAAHAAVDPSPGRPYQRFTFGALAMEMAVTRGGDVITREFLQAASLWLLDAAAKGWTGFFRAWVRDGGDDQVVEIRLGTVFDMPTADLGIEH